MMDRFASVTRRRRRHGGLRSSCARVQLAPPIFSVRVELPAVQAFCFLPVSQIPFLWSKRCRLSSEQVLCGCSVVWCAASLPYCVVGECSTLVKIWVAWVGTRHDIMCSYRIRGLPCANLLIGVLSHSFKRCGVVRFVISDIPWNVMYCKNFGRDCNFAFSVFSKKRKRSVIYLGCPSSIASPMFGIDCVDCGCFFYSLGYSPVFE